MGLFNRRSGQRNSRYPGIGPDGFILLTLLPEPSNTGPVAADLEAFLKFVNSLPYFVARQRPQPQFTVPPFLQVHPAGGFELAWPFSVFALETLLDYLRCQNRDQAWVLAWHDPESAHVYVEVGVVNRAGWSRIACPIGDWVLARSEPARFVHDDVAAPYSDVIAGAARRDHSYAQIARWADRIDSNAVKIMVENGLDEAARFLQRH